MSSKQIATSVIWQIGSQIVMAALSIVMVKLVTIGLSKELVGTYNSAYGFLQLFGILADFGLYAVAVRELSKAKDQPAIFGALLTIRLGILLITMSCAIALAWLIPAWQNTPLPLAITIAALVPVFTLMAGILRTVFQVHFAMQYIFIAEVLQRVISTIVVAGFILTGTEGSTLASTMYWFLLAGGIGSMMLFIASWLFARRFIPLQLSLDFTTIKRIFLQAAPYGLAFFCMALYRQFDITLIALLHADFAVQNAYYGVVMRMVEMGYVIPTFLLNSTLPVLSAQYAAKQDTSRLLGKTLFTLLILGSVSMLFSLIWASPLITLLTTPDYLATADHPGSDTALRLMSVPIFLNGLIVYGFYVLLTMHEWRKLVLILLLGAIVSLALNLWLIPSLGFVGAGITSIIVHLLVALLLMITSLRLLPPFLQWHQVRSWSVFTLTLTIILLYIAPLLTNEIYTIVGLTAAIILIGVLLKITGVLRSFTQLT